MTASHTNQGLSHRVAVVTGAGRGLGKAIATSLAAQGARVVLVARTASQLEETAEEIRQAGGAGLALPLDVTEAGAPHAALQAAEQHYGAVDILVMSSGAAVTCSALEVSLEDWDRVMNVNLRAAFLWSQAAGRVMSSRGGGRIIHLASVVGQVGAIGLLPYCASKGGLIALTQALAVEWAPLGITVNAIAPGYVPTSLNAKVLANERVATHITRRIPMRRLGRAEEVAVAAAFLASDGASYITGHVLAVDGGWLAS